MGQGWHTASYYDQNFSRTWISRARISFYKNYFLKLFKRTAVSDPWANYLLTSGNQWHLISIFRCSAAMSDSLYFIARNGGGYYSRPRKWIRVNRPTGDGKMEWRKQWRAVSSERFYCRTVLITFKDSKFRKCSTLLWSYVDVLILEERIYSNV